MAPERPMRYFGALAAAALLTACGGDGGGGHCDEHNHGDCDVDAGYDCSMETRADTFTAGLEKTDGDYSVLLLESDPAPPAKNDNAWTVQVLGPEDAPVDGAELDVTPFMPDHGHGTPIRAEVTPQGSDGTYDVDPVNLWMPGLWEIAVDVSVDSSEVASVVYSFCIEG